MGQNASSTSAQTAQIDEGTVKPAVPFDKDADATALNQAMVGLGTDEDAINAILTKRSNNQRQEIKEAFKTKYKLNLVDCLKDELSGDYCKTVKCLMDEPAVMLAKCINRLCKCSGDKMEIDLLEIVYPLHPMEVLGVAAAYKERPITGRWEAIQSGSSEYVKKERAFSTDLLEDVTKAVKGPFKNVIGNILVGERSGTVVPDMRTATDDASYFFKTKPEEWQMPNERVEELLGKASIAQLRQTFMQADAQFQANNQSLEKIVLDSAMDEIQKAAFTVIFKCICQPLVFYVDALYFAMKGLGTDDDKLIRIIVLRSEIDLASIKSVFKDKYTTTLAAMVEGDTSGDYKNILIGIINADATPAPAATQSTTT